MEKFEKMVLSVREGAGALGVSLPTMYALINSEGFPCLMIGRRRVIPVDAFKRWIGENMGRQINL
jgi:excisionase family DNA binding protein